MLLEPPDRFSVDDATPPEHRQPQDFSFAAHKKDFLLAASIGLASGFFAIVSLICIGSGFGLATSLLIWVLFSMLTIVGLTVGLMLARSLPVFFQIVKFGMVGGFNTMLELAVVNIFIVIFSSSSVFSFVIFKTVSFLLAAISAYFWNRNWTFLSRSESSFREFAAFAVCGFFGLLINVGVATLLVSWVGPPEGIVPILWVNCSILIAVLVGMAWNFVAQRYVIFRSAGRKSC